MSVALTLEQLEPTQRRRAEALLLVKYLWPSATVAEGLRVASWVITGARNDPHE